MREPPAPLPGTFTLLCGVPGSGKSTWSMRARLLNPDTLVISSDEVLERLALDAGLSYQDAYARHSARVMEDNLERAREGLRIGRAVVWDQTNLTLAVRAEKLALLPRGALAHAVAFEVSEAEQARRLAGRELTLPRQIPGFILERQRADYVRPTTGEGFDGIWVCRDGEWLPALAGGEDLDATQSGPGLVRGFRGAA
jgi:predicted kinase